jgi:hypothetical protein
MAGGARSMPTKPRPYWICRGCGYRNERAVVKCRGEGCQRRRPKKRIPKHAEVLRDMSYEAWELLSQQLHGGELGACGVCRKPKPEHGRHERDHDHRTGKPRGLACFVCNHHLLRLHTVETLRACLAYMERAA